MAKKLSHDPSVAAAIEAALTRIKSGSPEHATLKKRVAAGTLHVNFDTVALESGVKRHMFDRPGGPYAAQYEAVAAETRERGKSAPLRKQLDEARVQLSSTKESLDRSRTYAAHLLVRMHKLELEVANLKEDIATMERGLDEEPLIGSGRVIGLPAPERSRPAGKGGSRQVRG